MSMGHRRAKLIRQLEKAGLTVKITNTQHLMVMGDDGRTITAFSGSPSDFRADRNALADLKRAGIDLKGKVSL